MKPRNTITVIVAAALLLFTSCVNSDKFCKADVVRANGARSTASPSCKCGVTNECVPRYEPVVPGPQREECRKKNGCTNEVAVCCFFGHKEGERQYEDLCSVTTISGLKTVKQDKMKCSCVSGTCPAGTQQLLGGNEQKECHSTIKCKVEEIVCCPIPAGTKHLGSYCDLTSRYDGKLEPLPISCVCIGKTSSCPSDLRRTLVLGLDRTTCEQKLGCASSEEPCCSEQALKQVLIKTCDLKLADSATNVNETTETVKCLCEAAAACPARYASRLQYSYELASCQSSLSCKREPCCAIPEGRSQYELSCDLEATEKGQPQIQTLTFPCSCKTKGVKCSGKYPKEPEYSKTSQFCGKVILKCPSGVACCNFGDKISYDPVCPIAVIENGKKEMRDKYCLCWNETSACSGFGGGSNSMLPNSPQEESCRGKLGCDDGDLTCCLLTKTELAKLTTCKLTVTPAETDRTTKAFFDCQCIDNKQKCPVTSPFKVKPGTELGQCINDLGCTDDQNPCCNLNFGEQITDKCTLPFVQDQKVVKQSKYCNCVVTSTACTNSSLYPGLERVRCGKDLGCNPDKELPCCFLEGLTLNNTACRVTTLEGKNQITAYKFCKCIQNGDACPTDAPNALYSGKEFHACAVVVGCDTTKNKICCDLGSGAHQPTFG